MATTRQILTISLPKTDAKQLNILAKRQRRPRSQVVRDAIEKMIALEEFDRLTRIGEQIAKKMGIETYEDVERIAGRHA